MLYRSKTFLVLWPEIFIATRSETPALTIFSYKLRCVKLRLEEGIPYSLLAKEAGVCDSETRIRNLRCDGGRYMSMVVRVGRVSTRGI